jgi:N utilization substance protein A
VRLANRLVDWNIDVKTEAQFQDMDIAAESRRAVSELFGDAAEYEEEYSRISELPGVDEAVTEALRGHNVDFIADFLALSPEDLAGFADISAEQLETLQALIDEHVVIVEEEEEEAPAEEYAADEGEEEAGDDEADEEEYECPECGAKITIDMTNCPNCGIGLSFVDGDEE